MVSEDQDSEIGVYSIEEDYAAMIALPRPPPPRRAGEWAPIFLPTEYAKMHNDITLEHYQLGERRLKTMGQEVSKLRENLRKHALALDKAQAIEQGEDLEEISRLA